MASAIRSAGALHRLPRLLIHSSTRPLPQALEEERRRLPRGDPRLLSSDSVGSTSSYRDSCKLNMGHRKHTEEEDCRLPRTIESRLARIQMEVDEDGRFWRASREQVRVLLQRETEREEDICGQSIYWLSRERECHGN